MNPIETIYINNVATDVEVINGVFKFPYNIGQELTAIRFVGTNANNTITSINLKKADLFASVSHLDYCFMNCTALTQIDFGKKSFGSLQHAVDTFKGCTELTTIKIDASSEWAPDVDLSDCPLTKASVWQFVNALKTYTSGLHHIIVSHDTWDSLTTAEKSELEDACEVKYWSIHAPYHIRGTVTSGTTEITLKINNVDVVVPCVNDEFDYEYPMPLTDLQSFATANTTITSLDFSDADDFNLITSLKAIFKGCTALTAVDLSNAVFENVTTTGDRYLGMFSGCTALTTVDLSNATFKSVTQAKCMFYDCSALVNVNLSKATFESLVTTGSLVQASDSDNMFHKCSSLVELDLSSATFDTLQETVAMFFGCTQLQRVIFNEFASFSALQNAASMFSGCTALTTVNFDNAMFDSLTNANNMFSGCTSLTSINLGNASFDNLINAGSARYQGMFYGCSALVNVNLSKATFKSLTSAQGMFYGCSSLVSLNLGTATFEALTDAGTVNYNGSGMFSGCTSLATLDLTSATFESLQKNNQMFAACRALTNIINDTPGKFPLSLNFGVAPLNYTSMLTVVNWLADLSGQTAQTLTLLASAWSALTASQQNTLTASATAKNWTIVH